MSEQLTVVTRKGQITIPADIRRALKLKRGDRVALSLEGADGDRATLRPARSVAEMTFGSVKPRRKPEDFKELRRQFEEDVVEQAAAEGLATDKGEP